MGEPIGNEETRFKPGQPSPNPGGRPKGLARRTRELVGGDGDKIALLWIETMDDVTLPRRERLEASKLLAERGWGKPAAFQLIEDDDPLGTSEESVNAAVERFRAEVIRLAPAPPAADDASGNGAAGEPH